MGAAGGLQVRAELHRPIVSGRPSAAAGRAGGRSRLAAVPAPVVRMPPSPTGWFHVGTVRTMLFNWLYARHTGGRVVLRFEDTDRARSTEEAVAQAEAVLRWLGIDWDDGPYRQTQRLDLYAQAAADLVDRGAAYPCYCTPEELAAERERRQAANLPLVYSGRCRGLSAEERAAREAAGLSSVVRLAMPTEGTTAIDDVVRGRVEWENALQGDHVIMRSDGTPTYLFANPFDDISMGITHVIRGEDLLPSTPRQLAVYAALDAAVPTYAHLPMVLGTDKKKLSKRHGAISVEEFRDRGVVPQALINYLALVGWSYDDHTTFMTVPELIERFSLERVNSSPGVFDAEKLEWLNGEHLRALPPGEFASVLQDYLESVGSALAEQPERVAQVAPIVQEKLRTLGQFEGFAGFLFGPPAVDPDAWARVAADPESPRWLEAARAALGDVSEWAAEPIHAALAAACETEGVKPRVLYMPIRVAIAGRTVAPGLYESLELLGRDESLRRIGDALARLTA
jgi:glutamyl-tRNA synthetase